MLRHTGEVAPRHTDRVALPRPLTVAFATAAVAAASVLAGCGAGSGEAATRTTTAPPGTAAPSTVAPSTAAPTTAAPPTVAATTTTTYAPTTPEGSGEAAVERLLATWDNHDRISAGEIATPSSVADLFTVTPRPLQARGCTDGQPPITCSYADRSPGGDFYDISATPDAKGDWYVDVVQLTPLP